MPANGEGSRQASWLKRLEALGLDLPEPPSPLGSYSPARQSGELLFLSGMLPLSDGKLALKGRVGEELTIEQGREAARLALLNGLSAALGLLGDPSRLAGAVRLGAIIAAAPGFTEHAAVADGASEVLAEIFDDAAGHTRLASGVQSLPLGSPIVLELIFAVRA